MCRGSTRALCLLALSAAVAAIVSACESTIKSTSAPDVNASSIPARSDVVRPKEITKVSARASVVLDKNCPDIVQPYTVTDNLASLGLFGVKEALGDLGKRFESAFAGKPNAPQPGSQSNLRPSSRESSVRQSGSQQSGQIAASTKLAAKQLNWLPMPAEVAYGERLHQEEVAILERDSKLGQKYYPVADKMLGEILSSIGQPHEYEFKLFILKNSTRNATARPGGFLYVDQGLVDDPAQRPKAYFALAHEVAHVLQRHETKELQSYVVDSISVKEDLVKVITSSKSDPRAIVNSVKVQKNQFTKHHVDQELQSDSCAARLLSRALPDQKALAASLNAFLNDLPKPERAAPQAPPQSDAEKLARSVHEIVDSPVKRHPSSQERVQNLRSIYAEIISGAPEQRR